MTRYRWLLLPVALLACDPPPSRSPAVEPPDLGKQILDGAQRAMGVWPTPSALQLVADATVHGPEGEFRTLIHSSSDGRVRMEQSPDGFVAGIGRGGAWFVSDAEGETEPSPEEQAFLRGHELHMLALLPRSRLTNPRALGVQELEGVEMLAVSLSLPGGDSLVAYYGRTDTLPAGLRITWTDPHVFVSWSDWTEHEGARLFREAAFRQGSEVFRYTYDELRLGALTDDLFEPTPTGRDPGAQP